MDNLFATTLVYKRMSWVDDETWNVAGAVAAELKLSPDVRHAFFMRLGLIEARGATLNVRELRARRKRAAVLRRVTVAS